MHPDRRFHCDDADALRAVINDYPFGQLFAATAQGPRVATVPMVWVGPDALHGHLARQNPLALLPDGAPVLFTVLAAHAYVSADDYDIADQVPTWNYISVEVAATAHRLDEAALVSQLDRLAALEEERLSPKPVWTRGQMTPARFEALLRALVAVELRVTDLRGTFKAGQDKPAPVRQRVADRLRERGAADMAQWMARLDTMDMLNRMDRQNAV